MEPWQEEELRQLRSERLPQPQCVCCGEKITSERCLELVAFGLWGLACERCVDNNLQWTEALV